jgi:5,10-methylenetetrahydrofolate reductase
VGDQKESKPVFDLESVQILKVIAGLNRGVDMLERPIKGATSLFAGATMTPHTRPLAPLLIKFEKKVVAGARFFQTQAVFDVERFAAFMDFARRFDVKVLAGILLLRSAKMARYVTANIPGIQVPSDLIARLDSEQTAEGALGTGVEIAIKTIAAVRPLCDGVHLMAIGAEDQIPMILDRAGLAPAPVTELG